jgi:branched-chain amino acid transport system ATP-binding protein
MSDQALEVRQLSGGYDSTQVLFDVDLVVPSSGCVAMLGLNGAGKTTLLNTLMGELSRWTGKVSVTGNDTTGLNPDEIIRLGVGYVPQDQAVFASLTVEENLRLGAMLLKGRAEERVERVLDLFPRLRDRPRQAAGTLSGGERKMLALGRALVAEPKLLLLDEVTEGVWPGVVAEIAERLREYAAERSLLLVEHNVDFALGIADEVYVLDRGRIVTHGSAEDVRNDPQALEVLAPTANGVDAEQEPLRSRRGSAESAVSQP